jgi:hypothetical protein
LPGLLLVLFLGMFLFLICGFGVGLCGVGCFGFRFYILLCTGFARCCAVLLGEGGGMGYGCGSLYGCDRGDEFEVRFEVEEVRDDMAATVL